MRWRAGVVAAVITFLPVSMAWGQGSGLAGGCEAVDGPLVASCRVAAQTIEALQPQVGMLIAGGNPTIGTASTGGLRLGILPRVSVTGQANVVMGRVPDLREVRSTPSDGIEYGELTFAAPSLSGTATVGVFRGMDVAPTIGGLGALDLVASATWVPFRLLESDDVRPGSADISWGGGVRVGLLRESFTLPGASISVMYHRLGSVDYGEICPDRLAASTTDGQGYTLEQGACVSTQPGSGERGDLGELHFDLSSWSTRVVVSKHILGLGLAAGVGYDRISSDLEVAVRGPWPSPGPTDLSTFLPNQYARISDVSLSQGRWSAFIDGSYSILLATIAAEVGWMQGGDAVAGYPRDLSDFDPGDGVFFGSLGLRVAL